MRGHVCRSVDSGLLHRGALPVYPFKDYGIVKHVRLEHDFANFNLRLVSLDGLSVVFVSKRMDKQCILLSILIGLDRELSFNIRDDSDY